MAESIKKNFVYSGLLTVANYLFPLITYPYVSRVLGVERIGLVNFVDGTINYFIIFSMMGLMVVGIRAVAANRTDKEQLDRTYSSLLALNMITTAIATIALLVCIQVVPRFAQNSRLMYVGVIKLISNFLMVEWVYKGLEEFRFITLRTVVIRALSCVAVFVFVRQESDFQTYYLIAVLGIACNALYNQLCARSRVRIRLRGLDIRPYVGSYTIMGIYAILTSLYTTFNVAFLGFTASDTQVGYYTTATKIYSILIAMFTALTTVMLPRLSALVSEGRMDEFRSLVRKSYSALFAIAVPCVMLTIIFAPEIIGIISGKGYEGAIVPMRIVMPLMIVIGIEQILVIQVLMPLGQDRQVFIGSLSGAAVGLTLNLLIVPALQSIGSAIVWVASELTVLIVAQCYVTRAVGMRFPARMLLINVAYMLPAAAVVALLMMLPVSSFIIMLASGALVTVYAAFIQIRYVRNPLLLDMADKLVKLIRRRRQ